LILHATALNGATNQKKELTPPMHGNERRGNATRLIT